jgi:SAM-dependent methyltransferase
VPRITGQYQHDFAILPRPFGGVRSAIRIGCRGQADLVSRIGRRDVTSQFDACSDTYSDLVNASVSIGGVEHEFYIRRKVDHLLDLARTHLGDPEGLTALDVGCGVGLTDAQIDGRIGDLHGIDTSGDSVAQAKVQNPAVAYQSYDGDRLPYDTATFDLVFAINVLHHVDPPDRRRFTEEMARVVRPGGIACIFEHNPFNPLTRWAVDRCEFDQGVVLLSRAAASLLLQEAGLEPAESRYIIFVPRNGAAIARAEGYLHKVPLGAQYAVAARRPV